MSSVDGGPFPARRLLAGGALALALMFLTACPSEGADEVSRDFEVYRVVIADMAATFPTEPLEPDEEPVIYLESFAPDGVSLQDQVDLVAAFDDGYELRFVDERVEALDEDLDGLPVREGSALLGLGPIVDADPLGVRVERYVDENEISAFRYSVDDDGWTIVGAPEEVPPEGFVVAP